MYVRKIAAAAGFACGAALAFAPLAAALPDPTLVTDTLGSEVASLNGLFQFDALLSGVPSTDYAPSGVGGLDTLLPSAVAVDAPSTGTPSTLDYLLFGVKPFDAGVSSDPGSFSELNGALTQFDNAYNVELYANGGALDTNINDYLYNGTIQTIVNTPNETATQAFDTLYNHGIGDLSGYFHTDLSAFDITVPTTTVADSAPAAAVDITPTVTGEISSLNSQFEFDALLAGKAADVIPGTAANPFDTIPVADAPLSGAGTLDSLLYGVNPIEAGPVSDPGSYEVLNGAEVKFDDAYNVFLYAAENQGALVPVDDVFGNHLDFVTGAGATAASAFENFYNFAIGDLGGFFGTDLSSLDISAATATSLFDLFDPSTAVSLF